MKEMVGETGGLRKAGFGDDVYTAGTLNNFSLAKNARVRFLKNEEEIKTESLLYGLS
jgi:hypothetical protein